MLLSIFFYISVQFSICQFSKGEIYKEVFKVRSGTYKSFYTVDYKYINLPKNLYDLNISFKLIRWVGFVPLCPSSINITSILQYGNFPLFNYDNKFQYNSDVVQKVVMDIPKAEKRINTRVFKLQSPKAGTWIFGSIFDNNDDFQHHVFCLADLRVTLTGFILNPVVSYHLPSTGSLITIPLAFNKPEGKLIEILSHSPMDYIRVSHGCRTCSFAVSTGIMTIPHIPTLTAARNEGLIFWYNDTIIYLTQVQKDMSLMMYVQSFSHSATEVQLLVEYSSIRSNKNAVFLPPLMKIRGDNLFIYKFIMPDSEVSNIPIILKLGKIFIYPFFIEPIKDQGGTLTVEISINKPEIENCTIYVCIAGFGLSRHDDLRLATTNSTTCRQSLSRSISDLAKFTFRFFYPEWSWWYVTMMVEHPSGFVSNYSRLKANLSIFSEGCDHFSTLCRGRGFCLLTGVDTGLVSSCRCFKPYTGLDCQMTYVAYLGKVRDNTFRRNWLVLSNLAFIPAVVIAAVQKLFVLMVVYTMTAGFSMVYHMCSLDYPDLAYCALHVEKLAYFDHLAAVTSIWITMINLTTLPYRMQMLLNIIMIFVCAVLADVIQKSIWFYCLPILIGLFILIICWVYRMRQLKCIFPPLDWWVFGLFPGLVIAGIGFMMFRLSINKEYSYYFYHSIWHIFIALCICFVLPNTKRWTKALHQSTAEDNNSQPPYNLLIINSQRWYKFKKDLNYYLHLDVLLNPLLERNSKWSIFKSY